MSNFTRRSPLDDAIDEAVRDLMHVDPRPGLRARVLGRLQDRVWRRALFGAPAFAALALVAVFSTIVLWRGDEPAPATAPPAGEVAAQPSAPPQPPPVAVAGSPRAANAPQPRPSPRSAEAIFGPRREQVSAASLRSEGTSGAPAESADLVDSDRSELSLPPLPGPRPITIAPITIAPIPAGSRSGSR
jgi:hypothetical protein